MMTLHGAAIIVLAATTAPPVPQPMAMDTPVSFGNIQAVCTGVGSAKDDPQWSSYPIRIEFSNGGAQYLSGAHVVLSGTGNADLNCAGPWVLVKGAAGSYHVTASINGSQAKPASATFNLRNGPQKRVVLRFPDFQANE
ncbi:MAG TPA: hypothetical protein VMU08_12640 [Rhizomicrobium sp.]|nr:hypothetical protein [Rhizomicrobium sp.]